VRNMFRFGDCRDCEHVGIGTSLGNCSECLAGENFEERVKDTVEEMMLSEQDLENAHEQ